MKCILYLLAVLSLCNPFEKEEDIYRIEKSQTWAELDYKIDIVPGSALDFSSFGLQDAPAGKYGWLRAAGPSFEFEGLPGKPQRFYGVNLCNSANYPSHEVADELADRLVRLGYNSIRIHHHDNGWKDPANRERMDYFLAAAISRGLYITTDFFSPLLARGSMIKVLEPQWLADEIRNQHIAAADLY